MWHQRTAHPLAAQVGTQLKHPAVMEVMCGNEPSQLETIASFAT